MRKLKLTVAYEGTRFHGWQCQGELRTVQGELERALKAVTGRAGAVLGAGRTDAGVHAQGQAAHFVTSSQLPAQRLQAALNANLPDDVTVTVLEEVASDFHARKSARLKVYEYRIYTGPTRPVMERAFVYYIRSAPSVARMKKAAAFLVGRHDFRAFADAQARVAHHVRTVRCVAVRRRAKEIVITVSGEGFLWKMVRSIAGTLVEVGRGKMEPEEVAELLRSGRRDRAGPTLPARGLTLLRVEY
jgi:tRNA pseudouridine38-40 synthase